MKAAQPEKVAIRERRLVGLSRNLDGEPVSTSPDCAPCRRQEEAADRADGTLQTGGRSPARRLPADRDPDSGGRRERGLPRGILPAT